MLKEEKTLKKKGTNKIKEEAYNINLPYFKYEPMKGEKERMSGSRFRSEVADVEIANTDLYEASKLVSSFFSDFTGDYSFDNDKFLEDYTIIPFFYWVGLNVFIERNANPSCILGYFNLLKNKFRFAFDMPTVEQRLVDIIEAVDEHAVDINVVSYGSQIGTNDEFRKMILNPRLKRLMRLKVYNNFIIETFLTMLHLFYWIDFKRFVSNTKNINEYIDKALKICFVLKDLLYKQLEEEYPTDLIQKTIEQTKIKKNKK